MQTSAWSRSLFGTADQNMRVSDAERQAVADRLAAHYADGRLDQAEFDERSTRAMSAKTRADLEGLLDDLPEPGMRGSGPAGASGIPAFRGNGSMSRRRRGHPLLALAVVAIVVISVAHVVIWLTAPWLWLGVLILVILAATGHLGHHHHHNADIDNN